MKILKYAVIATALVVAAPLSSALALQCVVSAINPNGDGTEECTLACADGTTRFLNPPPPVGTCKIGDPYHIPSNMRKRTNGDLGISDIIL